MVATHAGDLDEGSKLTVLGAACAANDMVDVAKQPDLATAVEQAVIDFGGIWTLHHRIQGLAEDLQAASSWSERQSRLGVFVVCESA